MSPNPFMMAPEQVQVRHTNQQKGSPQRQRGRRGSTSPKNIPFNNSTTSTSQRRSPKLEGNEHLSAKKRVSFVVSNKETNGKRETLSDSELLTMSSLGDNYAGAKFGEAPNPANLPLPPSGWLGAFAASPSKTDPAPPPSCRSFASGLPLSFVPCDKLTSDLKLLLKVES